MNLLVWVSCIMSEGCVDFVGCIDSDDRIRMTATCRPAEPGAVQSGA